MNSFTPTDEFIVNPQSHITPTENSEAVSSSSVVDGADEAAADDEPSLREFTLLVSKLLFHLSQM